MNAFAFKGCFCIIWIKKNQSKIFLVSLVRINYLNVTPKPFSPDGTVFIICSLSLSSCSYKVKFECLIVWLDPIRWNI